MINIHNLSKLYPPDQYALRGVELKVPEGEFLFIAGASGAGKTTLLKLLFAAEKASSGQLIVGGRNLSSIQEDHIAYFRREIGVVFQDYKLLPRRTVVENVAFTLEAQGICVKERTRRAEILLDSMGLKDKMNSSPLTLSGGEQQRVSIARALINNPRLLLADEPTGNLDPEMTKVVFDILLDANAHGMTVVVATHNIPLIEDLNKRTIVLDKGKIIGDFATPRYGN